MTKKTTAQPANPVFLSDDFFALGGYAAVPVTSISPFNTPIPTAHALDPALLTPEGKIKPELQPLIDFLAAPLANAEVSAIREGVMVDTAAYYPAPSPEMYPIGLTHKENLVTVFDPLPFGETVDGLAYLLGSSDARPLALDVTLSGLQCWTLLTAVDIQRRRSSDPLSTPTLISADEIFAAMQTNAPQELGSCFAESLKLAKPAKKEVTAAWKAASALPAGEGKSLGGLVPELAQLFKEIQTRIHLQYGWQLNAERSLHFLAWAVQGKSNAILLWDASYDGQVSLMTISPQRLVEWVKYSFADPVNFLRSVMGINDEDLETPAPSQPAPLQAGVSPLSGVPSVLEPPAPARKGPNWVLIGVLIGLAVIAICVVGAFYLAYVNGWIQIEW
jgi:hypothetical protein